MARIRSIKPEFWTDEAIVECSTNARLLFIGTWNFADDFGNMDRSPKQIKARIFPADSINCEPLIQELLSHGLLVEYSANGKIYLHIQGFTKHQRVDKPGAPQCPVFDESQSVPRTLVDNSTNILGTFAPEGKGGEGKGTNKARKAFELPDWVPKDAWESFVDMRARKAPLTPRAKELAVKVLAKLRDSGHNPEAVINETVLNGWRSFYAPKGSPQQRLTDQFAGAL